MTSVSGNRAGASNLLMHHACNADSERTMDSLFSYVAAAHGLHRAAREAIAAGRSDWEELHSLGQLFLSYAVADIGVFASHEARGQGEMIH